VGIGPHDVPSSQRLERLFRRQMGFRRIFSRFDKPNVMFLGLMHFALIVEPLRMC
jgi:hypothetical protein